MVDGEAIVKRVLGELVDLQAFDEAAYECIGSSSKGLHERIAQLHGYLGQMCAGGQVRVPGIPEPVLSKVLEIQATKKDEEDEEENWGDIDEVSW